LELALQVLRLQRCLPQLVLEVLADGLLVAKLGLRHFEVRVQVVDSGVLLRSHHVEALLLERCGQVAFKAALRLVLLCRILLYV